MFQYVQKNVAQFWYCIYKYYSIEHDAGNLPLTSISITESYRWQDCTPLMYYYTEHDSGQLL